jgi:serine O-acetyltransferase
MFSRLRSDIRCILERDPAARNAWEILTCYPGLHAIFLHRVAHWCWCNELHWLGRFIAHLSRFFTGIEIHPAAKIGQCVFFDHGMGTAIGETAEIGQGCTIYQGVTLGGTSLSKGEKRHPTLGRGVVVSAGAKVLGNIFIGDGARIGANAVVLTDVPAGATAVGVPARIILAKTEKNAKKHIEDVTEHSHRPFSPYGVCDGDAQSELAAFEISTSIDHNKQQIMILWQAIEQLSKELHARTELAHKEDKKPIDQLKDNLK